MTDFLRSVKADLLDRRMLPIVVLLGVAFVGALAYAVLGGGSSVQTPSSTPVSAQSAVATTSISPTAASDGSVKQVDETTSGLQHRGAGLPRDPFAPLPGAKTASTTASSTPAAGSGSGASSPSIAPIPSGSSSPTTASAPESGGESTGGAKQPESKPPTPNKHTAKKTVYVVSVLFGAVPAGSPTPSPSLTPFEKLKREEPLPSATQPLVVFRGVTAGGQSATFTLVGEAILRGEGACQPSPSQCQAIDLKQGQSEELEYVPPEGTPVIYQLQIVSIDATKASAAAASAAYHGQSKAGLDLLRSAGLSALPGFRYSADKGVLVFAHHSAFAARAHDAAWAGWLRG